MKNPAQGPSALARIRLDTLVGMAMSNLVGLAILITAAATLHQSGTHEIQTAAQAAQTLRPIAGEFAFLLFALGIVGTGLLSIPVLAGSAAYALGEARRWPVGVARRPLQAKAFYATILAAIVIGAVANVLSISPMRCLVWAAVINGIVAVPVMTLLMRMAVNTTVMGRFTVSGPVLWLGWLATGVMAAAATGWAASWFIGAAQ